MDVGDGRSQTWVETERERGFRGLLWRSDAELFFVALVVALRHFFVKDRKLAFFSEGILSFVTWLAFQV
jgi:hypothetical protein